jgi:hypothetical protein
MDNQEIAGRDNVAADAPLLSPQAQEDVSAQPQEAPIPLHDPEPSNITPAKTAKSDDEPLTRPDYYPEKFWDEDGPDVEKLAKSYNELQKKFSQGKHKVPENGYNLKDLVDAGLNPDDPTVSAYQEWAKENGISQAAFEDLASRVLQLSSEQAQQLEYDRNQEMQKLGERAAEKIQMAERLLMKAPLNNNEREAIANSLDSADAINAFLKYHQALTNEGIPTQVSAQSPDMTREDLEAAIADPRWRTDTAFRSRIEKQWMASQG